MTEQAVEYDDARGVSDRGVAGVGVLASAAALFSAAACCVLPRHFPEKSPAIFLQLILCKLISFSLILAVQGNQFRQLFMILDRLQVGARKLFVKLWFL